MNLCNSATLNTLNTVPLFKCHIGELLITNSLYDELHYVLNNLHIHTCMHDLPAYIMTRTVIYTLSIVWILDKHVHCLLINLQNDAGKSPYKHMHLYKLKATIH